MLKNWICLGHDDAIAFDQHRIFSLASVLFILIEANNDSANLERHL